MKKWIRIILIPLFIMETSNKNRIPKIGKGFNKAYRLNPYNPINYFLIPIALVICVLLFGFVGVWKEVEWKNPFKWN